MKTELLALALGMANTVQAQQYYSYDTPSSSSGSIVGIIIGLIFTFVICAMVMRCMTHHGGGHHGESHHIPTHHDIGMGGHHVPVHHVSYGHGGGHGYGGGHHGGHHGGGHH